MLHQKQTIKGFFWNFLELTAARLINFAALMFLARLLTEGDFGLIRMTVIFTAVAQIMIDGGFGNALIRKQDCTEKDYNTVFYINITVSLLLYALFFFSAPLIANYYNEPQLTLIIRVITLILPINALAIIQKTILTKELNFKTQAIASFIGVSVGFGVAVAMAFNGFGVWSLVIKTIVNQAVVLIILWFANKWRPKKVFSAQSFRELFGFGSKLLVIYLAAQILRSIYDSIIGKSYSKQKLGLYSNADAMAVIQSEIVTTMLNKVAFSALSPFGNSPKLLKENLQKIMSPFIILSFTMSCVLIVIAEPLIIIALGQNWLGAVPYFQMLCLGYAALVLHIENQIVMNITGHSDYFLKTEILKMILFVPVIVLGIIFGLKTLIIGLVVHYWLGFAINSIYTKKLIDYGLFAQIKDLIKPALFALGVGICTFAVIFFNFSPLPTLILQFFTAIFSAFLISKIFKMKVFRELKALLFNILKNK
ncbi:MAG: lipopolysaccharide biosynthesis protein [Prevotellaceae bacterium]|jgi:O-antigen/teichoic acid export membrane protein|nr:lipopolysaccharide biosynthesis protein [Prevotellaceae bacterium]